MAFAPIRTFLFSFSAGFCITDFYLSAHPAERPIRHHSRNRAGGNYTPVQSLASIEEMWFNMTQPVERRLSDLRSRVSGCDETVREDAVQFIRRRPYAAFLCLGSLVVLGPTTFGGFLGSALGVASAVLGDTDEGISYYWQIKDSLGLRSY